MRIERELMHWAWDIYARSFRPGDTIVFNRLIITELETRLRGLSVNQEVGMEPFEVVSIHPVKRDRINGQVFLNDPGLAVKSQSDQKVVCWRCSKNPRLFSSLLFCHESWTLAAYRWLVQWLKEGIVG